MANKRRRALYDELSSESRRYMASYALFNQAVADRLGLHPTDVQCLSLLTGAPEPLTVKQISEMTGLTTGSATRLVDRLERGGYVTRTTDVHDRRRVLVTPVSERLTRVSALWDDLGEGWQAMLSEHTDDDLEVIIRYMRNAQQLSRIQIERLKAGAAPRTSN
ncbi:MarR family transcriptional regulator [Nocardia cyriacigeorgica]|nr:MarR family transcriptional regulator [Nocardia cyriacigeorgica]MBF6090201.1 MarR family transcriptional regulator [Nocardia cyriacigeorgica]MBF6094724.1 MarR family transcriptional regulator [Nocardia cyriacigeorgica]MBF6098646.1 MarR family transcriptional regulator [Nocardia cyriacigeorgica]MBF6162402.1 MarR family transcriptional regulator [Nocardia cyriacigeorgica]MBF6201361.1 MarR family transcriptional regulator [Nocardia cyriacigeorgica]